jgi:hypothetical protein
LMWETLYNVVHWGHSGPKILLSPKGPNPLAEGSGRRHSGHVKGLEICPVNEDPQNETRWIDSLNLKSLMGEKPQNFERFEAPLKNPLMAFWATLRHWQSTRCQTSTPFYSEQPRNFFGVCTPPKLGVRAATVHLCLGLLQNGGAGRKFGQGLHSRVLEGDETTGGGCMIVGWVCCCWWCWLDTPLQHQPPKPTSWTPETPSHLLPSWN